MAEQGNKKQQKVNVADFDDMLPIIGEFGVYQKLLVLMTIPSGIFMAFIYFTQIFLTLMPDNWCNIPELSSLSIDERKALGIPKENGVYSSCYMYDVNYTQLLADGVKEADTDWPKIKCKNGHFYDKDEIPYATVASEQNWVCEREVYATYAQCLFFIGAIVGGLLCGWIADKFGRLPTWIFCNLIACVAGMCTATSTSFWQFAMWRFLVGLGFDNCFMMLYILVLEYVGPKYRTLVANLPIALWFTLGSAVLPWIAYFIANWQYLALVTSAPLVYAIFTPLFLPESARWLMSKGRIKKATKIIKKVAKVNGKDLPEATFTQFEEMNMKALEEEDKQRTYTILDLFRSPRLRRLTIILIIIWMIDSIVFDGHARSISVLGTDIFQTFTIASLTECPAGILLLVILDRWGRRFVGSSTLIACGLFTLIAAILPHGIVSTSMVVIGRFFINVSYNVGMQYAAEILPTVVRAQGVAFIHIMGFVACISSPFIVYTAHLFAHLPLFLLSILSFIGGILTLFLPETLNEDLSETLEDGENFGKSQLFWDFPFLKKQQQT